MKELLSVRRTTLLFLFAAFLSIAACNNPKDAPNKTGQPAQLQSINTGLYTLYLTHDQLDELLKKGKGPKAEKLTFEFYHKAGNDSLRMAAWTSRNKNQDFDSSEIKELSVVSLAPKDFNGADIVLGSLQTSGKAGFDKFQDMLKDTKAKFIIFSPRIDTIKGRSYVGYDVTTVPDLSKVGTSLTTITTELNPSPPRAAD